VRIAVIHSYYSSRQPSGENATVDEQVAALSGAGHQVRLLAQRTDQRERFRDYRLHAAFDVATGRGPDPSRLLHQFQPDVVHLHNLFPNIATHWLRTWTGPIVATIQNFRPICPAGTLLRDGKMCTLCPDGYPASAVKYACYRGSRLATLPLAIRSRNGPGKDAVLNRADALICVSERSADVYRQYVSEPGRIRVVENFIADPHPGLGPRDTRRGETWLYAGRLSPEKGIEQLLRAWPDSVSLDIIGDGPLRERLCTRLPPRVHLLGARSRGELLRLMPTYAGLVFPSIWPEGLPVVVIEALASGLPVIAAPGSSASDLVSRAGVGRVLPERYGVEDVLAAVQSLEKGDFASAARVVYLRDHSVASWLSAMTKIYSEVTAR
jgi:glycosyltransferase involved in cell wall biosynthesis